MTITALKSVTDLLGDSLGKCESPSLRLEKFVHIGDNSKKNEIDAVVACQKSHSGVIPEILPKAAIQFTAKLEGRLIVNQAGGILENAGLCLHRHFGTPYIPGSAVKGIARHAAWCEWNECEDETKKAEIANKIAQVFGYPTSDDNLDTYLSERGWKDKRTSGSVCFMSAVPKGAATLVTDIVNCHHMKYYSGTNEDAIDNEQPNPQFFPAVERNASFVFTIAPVRGQSGLLDTAKHWLVEAITIYGAGGKTAAGYGWFSYDPVKEAEERKRCFEAAARKKAKLEAEEQKKLREKEEREKKEHKKSMTPEGLLLEQWENVSPKSIINGDVKNFPKYKEEKKKAIVTVLRMPEGKGKEVWSVIKEGQKGDIAKAVQEIRFYCKTAMQLGKMP